MASQWEVTEVELAAQAAAFNEEEAVEFDVKAKPSYSPVITGWWCDMYARSKEA